jgi:uncharacterized protein YegP (UPF0339 family)
MGRVGQVEQRRSKGIAKEYRWRVRGVNGEILAAGEGYTRHANMAKGLKALTKVLASWFPQDARAGLTARRGPK